MRKEFVPDLTKFSLNDYARLDHCLGGRATSAWTNAVVVPSIRL